MTNKNKDVTLESFGYKQELNRVLKFSDLVIYGLIFMVPIAPFGIYGYVANISMGMVALAYIIGMSGMIFTAFSYWRMSEAFPISGSVYAYSSRGIGKAVGFVAGWTILSDYILVPALLYVVSAAALGSIIPQVPALVWIVGFILINTVINVIGIEFTAKFNKIVLILELIIFVIFVVIGIIAVSNGVGDGFTLKPLYDAQNFNLTLVMGAVSIAVLSFLGFDGISTLAEETEGGGKTVGKATVAALLMVGVLFITQTYVAALVWPDYTTFTNLDTAFYDIASLAGGAKLMWLCAIATGFAWGIANSLAAQAAIARIIFSMSRDRLLPKALNKVHPKFKTPYVATIFVAIISLVITVAFSNNIAYLSSLVNFGALSGFIVLNFTVIFYFIYKQKSTSYIKHLLLPLIGILIVGFVWLNLDSSAKTLGAIWVATGIVYYIIFVVVLKRDLKIEV
jgi:amino acid transporter